MLREPDFYVVGAQKAGTTALHQYLLKHQGVFLPSFKESKWFVDPVKHEQSFEHYLGYFSDASVDQKIGEIDPDIMYFPESLERMQRYLDVGNKKLIFILREPASRAFSHYLMTYRRGHESLSFMQALEAEEARLREGSYFNRESFSYADRGFYSRQIERFLAVVPREHMLFLLSDELNENPSAVLGKVCRFIGVDEYMSWDEFEKVHQAQVPRNSYLMQRLVKAGGWEKKVARLLLPSRKIREKIWFFLRDGNLKEGTSLSMSTDARSFLSTAYAEELPRLQEMTGLDLSGWIK